MTKLRKLPNGQVVSIERFKQIVAEDYLNNKSSHGGDRRVSNGNTAVKLSKKYGISMRTVKRYFDEYLGSQVKKTRTHQLYTYLLEAEVMPGQYIYKIGKTTCLTNRIKQLESSTFPFEINLNTFVKGDYERKFHQRFANNRINDKREWFRFTREELLDVFMAYSEPRLN